MDECSDFREEFVRWVPEMGMLRGVVLFWANDYFTTGGTEVTEENRQKIFSVFSVRSVAKRLSW